MLLFLNIGGSEIFIIVLVIIMFFGSKKIPELARGLGKGIRELKNATSDIQQEIQNSAKDIEKVKDSVDVEKQFKNGLKRQIKENKQANSVVEETIIKGPQNSVSRSSTGVPSQEDNSKTTN